MRASFSSIAESTLFNNPLSEVSIALFVLARCLSSVPLPIVGACRRLCSARRVAMAVSAVCNSVSSCCCTRRISSLFFSIPCSWRRTSRRCSQRLPSSSPIRLYARRNSPPLEFTLSSWLRVVLPRPNCLRGLPPPRLASDCPSRIPSPSSPSLLLSSRSFSRLETLNFSDDNEAAVSRATSASSPFIASSAFAAFNVLVLVPTFRLTVVVGSMLLVTAMICLRNEACPRRARKICVRHWARLKLCSAASSSLHPAGSRGVYVDTGSCWIGGASVTMGCAGAGYA
mmetsp:Transcript_19151/g.44147  ORF Transcript_19151/g.44147 Transcript_19151/m.44147 type:complete len:285 (+) Transcript_19151:312-1166(+)